MNRKGERTHAAIKRRNLKRKRLPGMGDGKRAYAGNRFKFLKMNWHKRIIKEMIQNKYVQEMIASGKFDWILK